MRLTKRIKLIKLKVEVYCMKIHKKNGPQPVYVYTITGEKCAIKCICPTAIKVLLPGDEYSQGELAYKDYGTTWALTKEELL